VAPFCVVGGECVVSAGGKLMNPATVALSGTIEKECAFTLSRRWAVPAVSAALAADPTNTCPAPVNGPLFLLNLNRGRKGGFCAKKKRR